MGLLFNKEKNEREKKKRERDVKTDSLRTRTEIVPGQARWHKESKHASPSATYLFFPHLLPTCIWNQEGALDKMKKRKKQEKKNSNVD